MQYLGLVLLVGGAALLALWWKAAALRKWTRVLDGWNENPNGKNEPSSADRLAALDARLGHLLGRARTLHSFVVETGVAYTGFLAKERRPLCDYLYNHSHGENRESDEKDIVNLCSAVYELVNELPASSPHRVTLRQWAADVEEWRHVVGWLARRLHTSSNLGAQVA